MSRKKIKKNNRNNKNRSSQFSAISSRLAGIWKQVCKIDSQIELLIQQGQEDSSNLEARYTDLRIKFDNLVVQAQLDGTFKQVINSAFNTLVRDHNSGLAPQHFIEFNEAVSEAHYIATWGRSDMSGNFLAARSVVFGIPVMGTRPDAIALVKSDFVKQVRKNGWAPEHSNVMCMGVLTASEAIMLTQDPRLVWNIATGIDKCQASSSDLGGVQIPGLLKDFEPSEEMPVGGYVLLMGVFAVGEELTIPAVDPPEEEEFEKMNEQWISSTQEYIQSNDLHVGQIGIPQSLSEASREAVAMQLELSLRIAGQQKDKTIEIILNQAAFLIDEKNRNADLVGIYSDGSQILMEGILKEDLVFLVSDLADRFGLEEPVEVLIKGMPLPWELGVLPKASNIVPFPGSLRKGR